MPRPSFIVRQNPLVYPAGVAPGFDPSHPIMAGGILRLSAVASSMGMIDVTSGTPGANTGSGISSVIKGATGPGTNYTATSGYTTISGKTSGIIDHGVTFAAICTFNAIQSGGSNGQYLVVQGTGSGGGWSFALQYSAIKLGIYAKSGNQYQNSTLQPVAGVPYFLAGTAVDATITASANFVMANLFTGQITSQVVTQVSANISSNSGSYEIGNGGVGASQQANAVISAVAQLSKYSQMTELLAWASDPWSFWYPRRMPIVLVGSSVSFLSAWAMNTNSPVLGTGTY